MEISDYAQYYQEGGIYVLPVEVFIELWGEMNNWKDTCKQKENIIKEVREYIEENYPTSTINYQDDKYKLLEILDKEK